MNIANWCLCREPLILYITIQYANFDFIMQMSMNKLTNSTCNPGSVQTLVQSTDFHRRVVILDTNIRGTYRKETITNSIYSVIFEIDEIQQIRIIQNYTEQRNKTKRTLSYFFFPPIPIQKKLTGSSPSFNICTLWVSCERKDCN